MTSAAKTSPSIHPAKVPNALSTTVICSGDVATYIPFPAKIVLIANVIAANVNFFFMFFLHMLVVDNVYPLKLLCTAVGNFQ